MKKALTIIFALAMILCLTACGNDFPSVIPDTTIPEVTVPDVTIPDVTAPAETEPDVTEPDVTEPDVTEPDVPEETDPPAPEQPHSHHYVETVTNAATCTAEGRRTYTCECGNSYTEIITKLGHQYADKVTAPTCAAQGYTTHTCTRCSHSYKDAYKNATGHSTTSKMTTAATCTKTGVKTITCSKCSYTTTETIAKTSHNYAASTCTKPKTCTICGATSGNKLGHHYSYTTTKNPTTGATGTLKGTCSRCSGTTTVTLPKLTTADYTRTVSKEATCTAAGTYKWTWKTTTYGNFSYTTSITAKGHSYKNATCTAPKTCTACGATSGNKLGHKWGTPTVGTRMNIACTTCGDYCTSDLGEIYIHLIDAYWKDGALYAECLVVNSKNYGVSNLNVKDFTIRNSSGPFVSGNFGILKNLRLNAYSYTTWTFKFSGEGVLNYGADLSGKLSCDTTIGYT